jgi:hypothetical protein
VETTPSGDSLELTRCWAYLAALCDYNHKTRLPSQRLHSSTPGEIPCLLAIDSLGLGNSLGTRPAGTDQRSTPCLGPSYRFCVA